MKLTTLRNGLIGILLFVLGLIVGQRYHLQVANLASLNSNNNQKTISALSKLTGQLTAPEDKDVEFDVFWEVWSMLEQEYLEPEKLNAEAMVNGAVQGMTAAIGDPYTIYLPPDDNKRSGENLNGSFYGVGIELGYIDGTLAVIAPLDDTPAAKAGLEAGDLILHVKDDKKNLDEDTLNWSLEEAVNNIRGERNTPITFTLYREDASNTFEVTVRRDEILIVTVKIELQEFEGKNIALLRVGKFGGRTGEEWDAAVAQIKAASPKVDGIVLDLRNNPGGYFDSSIELASDFIKSGVVVSQKDKYTQQDFRSIGTARLKDYPLVVLVNKGSASASEILAGALRDDLGVKLIGEQTFGKGTVQDRKAVSNGGGVHITVGRWLLPSGAWIHDEGIPVDIEVEQNRDTEEDEVLQRGLEEVSR
jgi:carboxyl-terminal processing protease